VVELSTLVELNKCKGGGELGKIKLREEVTIQGKRKYKLINEK
jgi:hypothetical protein